MIHIAVTIFFFLFRASRLLFREVYSPIQPSIVVRLTPASQLSKVEMFIKGTRMSLTTRPVPVVFANFSHGADRNIRHFDVVYNIQYYR